MSQDVLDRIEKAGIIPVVIINAIHTNRSRHIDDWCHFFLIDRRYGTHWRFISKWAVKNGIEEAPLEPTVEA